MFDSGPCLISSPTTKKKLPRFFLVSSNPEEEKFPNGLNAREEPMPLLPTPLASPGLATPNTVSRRSRWLIRKKKRWKMEIAEG